MVPRGTCYPERQACGFRFDIQVLQLGKRSPGGVVAADCLVYARKNLHKRVLQRVAVCDMVRVALAIMMQVLLADITYPFFFSSLYIIMDMMGVYPFQSDRAACVCSTDYCSCIYIYTTKSACASTRFMVRYDTGAWRLCLLCAQTSMI